jgi:uncharacterized protein
MWNLPRWISMAKFDGITRRRRTRPDIRLKVSNLTRQAVLARYVEVANHGASRRKGLLGRDRLSVEEGLWIVPCEAVHTIGMRFPIDLVYLDRNMRVKRVRSNVPPLRLSACPSAHSVLELASGTIQRTQTMPGDKLEISPLIHSMGNGSLPNPEIGKNSDDQTATT